MNKLYIEFFRGLLENNKNNQFELRTGKSFDFSGESV